MSLLIAGGAISRAAQEQPAFRAGVHVVEVDVRVFDSEGRFVSDLTRGDFELLENETRQQLQTVYLVEGEWPGQRLAQRDQEPPLAGPASPSSSATARQTWIFVFDPNHLTIGAGFDRARGAVEEFVRDRFKDGDVAGVVAGTRMVNNRLTSVREELVAAVKSVKPLVDARRRRMEQMELRRRMAGPTDRQESQEADETQRASARKLLGLETERALMETLTALNEVAAGLVQVQGPKTIVLLSDGFSIERREATVRNVVGQIGRAGARLYAIDVRGLNRDRGAADVDRPPIDIMDETDPLRPPRSDALADGVNSLAVDTGGMMIRNENNIGRALDTIASDANRYYILTYQPINTNFDGKFRPIEVRVTRPGVRVRARRGYVALEPSR